MVVNVKAGQYTVNDFLGWMRNGSLTLSPNFQRRSVWSPIAKSYLIDTILKEFPVPLVMLRLREEIDVRQPSREVVDGQQRLRTLIGFIEPELLDDYNSATDDFTIRRSHNRELAGKKFTTLPSDLQKRILGYEFSVQTLPSNVSDREVLQIFARLNSTGLKLNAQELRNAEFSGLFKTAMYDLALRELERWRQWTVFDEVDIARMEEVELTSDLILMMLYGVQGKTQPALNNLYKLKDEDFPEEDEVGRRFGYLLDSIDDLLGADMAETVFARETWLHSLFTYLYDLAYGLKSPLNRRIKPASLLHLRSCLLRAADKASKIGPTDELFKAVRGSTSQAESRNARLRFLRNSCKRA